MQYNQNVVTPPILDNKRLTSPSVFTPSALIREARRQKKLATVEVPRVCLLDPDGDIVRRLRETGRAKPFESWPCYHTELDTFLLGAHEVGIVGRVVGASFAVLVAEELFASGCRLLVSLTSTGQVMPAGSPPYFVVIDRALRDEGHKLSLCGPVRVCRSGPRTGNGGSGGSGDAKPLQRRRFELDHRCAFPRNG
jgi:hypothetical protein